MISLAVGSGLFVGPAQGGIGEGISGTTTIDTQPPLVIVDQLPELVNYRGGETILFHWQTSDSHPGNIPEHFTATVWIEGQVDSTIIYYPDTSNYSWEWIVPEMSSGNVHLEVRARDAFGALTTGTTNNFVILTSVTDVPTTPGNLNLAVPAPNPFNPSTRLNFKLPEPGRVALTVYDTRGRLVRSLLRDERQEGDFATRWNGRDDQGRTLPGGVYLFVLDFHGASQSGRITRKAVLIP